jgi:hypothetical protein
MEETLNLRLTKNSTYTVIIPLLTDCAISSLTANDYSRTKFLIQCMYTVTKTAFSKLTVY